MGGRNPEFLHLVTTDVLEPNPCPILVLGVPVYKWEKQGGWICSKSCPSFDELLILKSYPSLV